MNSLKKKLTINNNHPSSIKDLEYYTKAKIAQNKENSIKQKICTTIFQLYTSKLQKLRSKSVFKVTKQMKKIKTARKVLNSGQNLSKENLKQQLILLIHAYITLSDYFLHAKGDQHKCEEYLEKSLKFTLAKIKTNPWENDGCDYLVPLRILTKEVQLKISFLKKLKKIGIDKKYFFGDNFIFKNVKTFRDFFLEKDSLNIQDMRSKNDKGTLEKGLVEYFHDNWEVEEKLSLYKKVKTISTVLVNCLFYENNAGIMKKIANISIKSLKESFEIDLVKIFEGNANMKFSEFRDENESENKGESDLKKRFFILILELRKQNINETRKSIVMTGLTIVYLCYKLSIFSPEKITNLIFSLKEVKKIYEEFHFKSDNFDIEVLENLRLFLDKEVSQNSLYGKKSNSEIFDEDKERKLKRKLTRKEYLDETENFRKRKIKRKPVWKKDFNSCSNIIISTTMSHKQPDDINNEYKEYQKRKKISQRLMKNFSFSLKQKNPRKDKGRLKKYMKKDRKKMTINLAEHLDSMEHIFKEKIFEENLQNKIEFVGFGDKVIDETLNNRNIDESQSKVKKKHYIKNGLFHNQEQKKLKPTKRRNLSLTFKFQTELMKTSTLEHKNEKKVKKEFSSTRRLNSFIRKTKYGNMRKSKSERKFFLKSKQRGDWTNLDYALERGKKLGLKFKEPNLGKLNFSRIVKNERFSLIHRPGQRDNDEIYTNYQDLKEGLRKRIQKKLEKEGKKIKNPKPILKKKRAKSHRISKEKTRKRKMDKVRKMYGVQSQEKLKKGKKVELPGKDQQDEEVIKSLQESYESSKTESEKDEVEPLKKISPSRKLKKLSSYESIQGLQFGNKSESNHGEIVEELSPSEQEKLKMEENRKKLRKRRATLYFNHAQQLPGGIFIGKNLSKDDISKLKQQRDASIQSPRKMMDMTSIAGSRFSRRQSKMSNLSFLANTKLDRFSPNLKKSTSQRRRRGTQFMNSNVSQRNYSNRKQRRSVFIGSDSLRKLSFGKYGAGVFGSRNFDREKSPNSNLSFNIDNSVKTSKERNSIMKKSTPSQPMLGLDIQKILEKVKIFSHKIG